MPATLQNFNDSSSTSTASASSVSTASAVHSIILAAKAAGLQLNASTLALVQSWLSSGLALDVITEYVIPETALAPKPSIRYAAAIARRLINERKLTLTQAAAPRQLQYEQREYREREPGQLPNWLREMMEEETAAAKNNNT